MTPGGLGAIRLLPGGVAQLVRAGGSYPPSRGFESLHRHQVFPVREDPPFHFSFDNAPSFPLNSCYVFVLKNDLRVVGIECG